MERESFEDEKIAEMMNSVFVCIKVDREERPDVDNIYMAACQMMTGGGGWPLTIITTPDLRPFFATTYVPPESVHGRIGMKELIPAIDRIWKEQRGKVDEIAIGVLAALGETSITPKKGATEDLLHRGFERFLDSYDEAHGGFGSAPKFPTPSKLLFLLRYWRRTGSAVAVDMVERTLKKMRQGGIWDHVGYGFHRYSTDRAWIVPHFEKMLYDQAMLAMV